MTTVVVVMGVSGSGKTTIGRLLADRKGWAFQEGDDLHSPANHAKMQAGVPLTDADRAPWLDAVAAVIDGWIAQGVCGVITCSALKRDYRDRLRYGRAAVRLAYLHGDPALLAQRVAARHGHFMPASLLGSQLATLEPPDADESAITVNVSGDLAAMVGAIATALPASTNGQDGCL